MNKRICIATAIITIFQNFVFAQRNEQPIYKNDAFSIFSNRVEQGPYKAIAISSTKIVSDYQSTAQNGQTYASTREIKTDLSKYPSFSSGFVLLNALYNLALEEMTQNIRPDTTFMAGKEWDGVWTRDVCYSTILSLALLEPEVAKRSLIRKTKNNRIIQDTGTGGSWPVSVDRQIWASAAWEIYKATGDKDWLQQAYQIISNSIEDDLKIVYNHETGLFFGESSFLDWREQTYPLWMGPKDIYSSQSLGTNAVFYGSLQVMSQMSHVLHIKNKYKKLAENLRNSINAKLWVESKNYYGQYLYGQYSQSLSPRAESLGNSLCLLFGIPDKAREKKLLESFPEMTYGIPTIYPQIKGIPAYHNEASWPFVQAFWTWAGAKARNMAIVEHGLAINYRQSALFLTNKENLVLSNGDYKGTAINSDRQLWSVAASLATVYRVLLGIELQADQLFFNPIVPKPYEGLLQLKGFKYRNALLDIKIKGFGTGIKNFTLDGRKLTANAIPSFLKGKHTIVIELNETTNDGKINLVKDVVSPEVPELKIDQKQLQWTSTGDAQYYNLYQDGAFYKKLADNRYDLKKDQKPSAYQVLSVDANGIESFLSNPVYTLNENNIIKIEAESFGKASSEIDAKNFCGTGFVEFASDNFAPYKFEINAPFNGEYIIEFRYANGSGGVKYENKCAIRSVYKSGNYIGAAVLPQRGEKDWSNWGLSNPIKTYLVKGSNKFEIRFDKFNANMNGEVNRFLLDQIRVFPAF